MDTIPSMKNLHKLAAEQESRLHPTDELHDDMEKIFEKPGEQEFSLRDLTTVGRPHPASPWEQSTEDIRVRSPDVLFGRDGDFSRHHMGTFPHVHHPLKPHHHHHKLHKQHHSHHSESESYSPHSLPPLDDDAVKQDEKTVGDEAGSAAAVLFEVGDPELPEGWSTKLGRSVKQEAFGPRFHIGSDTGQTTDDEAIEPERLPLLPDVKKITVLRGDDSEAFSEDEQKKSRVTFEITGTEEDERPKSAERPRHHHKKKRRKGPHSFEDPAWRTKPGSHVELVLTRPRRMTDDEEDSHLCQPDLEHMSTHRFDDISGYHRQRLRSRSSITQIIHPSNKVASIADTSAAGIKKIIDHRPHEVFVELDELKSTNTGFQWKETARWIKYEEDVEEVSNRWGKPHLAFLNFHALFSLRRGLERGSILLDLPETDLPAIAARIVDRMVVYDQIPAEQRDAIIRILLLRHRHIKEKERLSFSPSQAKLSRSATVTGMAQAGRKASIKRAGFSGIFPVNTFTNLRRVSVKQDKDPNGIVPPEEDEKKRSESAIQIEDPEFDYRERLKRNDILRKIPLDAEATAVLVGSVDFLDQPSIAFVRLSQGVMMENLVEVPIPVRFLFVLLGPLDCEMDYHEVGRSISTLMSDKTFREVAYRAHSRGQLLLGINEFLNASIVLPPSDWKNKDLIPVEDIREKAQQNLKKKVMIKAVKEKEEEVPVIAPKVEEVVKKPPPRDHFRRTKIPFHGVYEDVKLRYSMYLSDILDGLNGQTLAAGIFIFFAALSAAITFGGMYGDKMDNYIGVSETLLLTCINGLVFALFAAQPALIVGSTGPLMVFDVSLYMFCKAYEIEYLPIRFWIGFWMVVASLIITGFELLFIVKKFSRFTEEIFATLICLIFVYEAFKKIIHIFMDNPLQASYCFEDDNHTEVVNGTIINGTLYNGTNLEGDELDEEAIHVPQPNTALLSAILMFGTFIIAIKLKHFRNSKFLGRSVRRALGDFGVPIAIFLMVLLDYLIKDTYTDKLTMPPGLSPSNPEVRGWIISPFGLHEAFPVWCIFLAAPASFLLFFLIFLEVNICELILGKPERMMKKGNGFNIDLILAATINMISGLFGAPFMGPACVRTVSHASALTMMSSTHAPGETPKVIGVKEQRVSPFIVSLLVGLSVLLSDVLNLIPKAVLLGIFLYMGISSMAGIQFLERCVLYFMPVKHHYNVPYVKKVRTVKMHLFTGVQLFMMGILWAVKQSVAALCFPFILLMLIPIRLYILPYLFTRTELNILDGMVVNETEEEPDFYEEIHTVPSQIDDGHAHQS